MAKRPSTIVVSVRCDLRDLTVAALWLNEQRRLPESIGSLGRTIVELFADMIRTKNPDMAKMTTAEALSYLSQMGLKRGERNKFSLVKRLELEDAALELAQPTTHIISPEEIGDIAEETIAARDGDYSKERMDEITNRLGGTVDGSGTDGSEQRSDDEGASPDSQVDSTTG